MSKYSRRLIQAKSIIKKVLQGINPVDESKIPQESIFNNIDFSRQLLEIYMLLDDLESEFARNNRVSKPISDFFITKEQYDAFVFFPPGIFFTRFCQELDKYAEVNNCRKIVRRMVNDWLISESIFVIEPSGKKTVSLKGQKLGFKSELRSGPSNGEYYVTQLEHEAQRFILGNYIQGND